MKDFSRMFIVEDGHSGGWTASNRTSFVVSVRDDNLSVTKKSGRDMFPEEVNTAFGRFLKEYETETGEKVARYERKHPYRFCFREGSSGCQDSYIEIDTGDGFPLRKHIAHMSCNGKTDGISCYVYDFLDMCVADGFFALEDGFYTYNEGEDANADAKMKMIKPRLTFLEKGWTQPWGKPTPAVPMDIVRDKPDEGDSATN